jgi:Amt family ammonium transporter
VSDTGIGFRPEDAARLFLEFSQVDSSASRQQQGTGLGLALSKRFVELHGGTIGAESIFGRGSTFWFILPVDGPLPIPAAAGHAAEREAS